MKKAFIGLVLIVALGAIFFSRVYTSSPGYVTQEMAEEFYADAPTCWGYSILLNAEATYADAAGKSLCIGLFK